MHFLVPEKTKMADLKTLKRCNIWYQKKPKYGHLRPLLTPKRLQVPENSKKVHFLVPEKAKKASLKTPKRFIICGQKMPKCVSLRPLLTPKRPLKYQVPKNSKKVQFPALELAKYGHLWPLLTPKRL